VINKFALHPFAVKPTDFSVGQTVQMLITSHYGSAFLGTVVAIVPETDKVHVQWPHFVGMHSPEDLIPVTTAIGVEPSIQQSRPSVVDLMVPTTKNAKVLEFVGGLPTVSQVSVVQSYLKKVSKAMKDSIEFKLSGLNEVETFSKVSSTHGDSVSDQEIRLVVSSLFNKEVANTNAVYLTVVYDLMNDKS